MLRQVIDEDTLRNRRPESMSVSVHGVQALFVKPAQSLAPILGMKLLPQNSLKTDLADMTAEQVGGFERVNEDIYEGCAYKMFKVRELKRRSGEVTGQSTIRPNVALCSYKRFGTRVSHF